LDHFSLQVKKLNKYTKKLKLCKSEWSDDPLANPAAEGGFSKLNLNRFSSIVIVQL
jgi:hypothetical protein